MRVGLWLPTFAADTVTAADTGVVELARLAERCGLDGLWVIDHMLPTTREVHSGSWYDPIVSLTAAAAVTESLELGTASLVAGPRHPVALAKQVASLAALAGPRVTIGVSSGWAPEEYECFGYRLTERGERTDEVAAVLRLLLETAPVDSPGPRYPFQAVRLVPRPRWRIPILIGGGSRTPESGSAADRPHMAASVLERIKRFDGWLAPCAGDESMTLADLALVNEAVGDRPFRRVHVQWTHIVDTDDTDRALAEQVPAFGRVMGESQHREPPRFVPDRLIDRHHRSGFPNRRGRLRRHNRGSGGVHARTGGADLRAGICCGWNCAGSGRCLWRIGTDTDERFPLRHTVRTRYRSVPKC